MGFERIEDAPKDCIRTYSGLYVNVFEPTEDMICIEDICHALSNQSRFSGHVYKFFSVAQHSSNCAWNVEDEHKPAALLHDATEAFLVDIPTPIKNNLEHYKRLEDNLNRIIANKFGYQYPFHESIKKVDRQMLQLEWDNLMINHDSKWICLSPDEAKKEFMELFNKFVKIK